MVEALGISLKEFIFYLINFVILCGALGFFLYKPFLAILDKRKTTIQDALDSAELTNRKADEKMANYERRIAKVEEEGREIIRVAKKDANDEAKAIIDAANARAGDMIVKAEQEIERERIKAMQDMRAEISSLAMMAAAKIVEAEINSGDRQSQIVDQIIEETGSSTWQN